ncbi:Uncharacterized protein OBRU01_04103 [Operophtera brumata]|uniref:Uncharacterized protein n=1 Tax=Operophtera brumata TaxID=104452 RepID=A0A0L7LQ44_OPEBR|nr:Uncharacterized protein OBRU01_04103 [Operophtera brumata]
MSEHHLLSERAVRRPHALPIPYVPTPNSKVQKKVESKFQGKKQTYKALVLYCVAADCGPRLKYAWGDALQGTDCPGPEGIAYPRTLKTCMANGKG